MEPELRHELTQLRDQLDRIERSAERTRKYLLWSLIAQLSLFFIPLVLLMLAIPFFLTTMTQNLDGLL